MQAKRPSSFTAQYVQMTFDAEVGKLTELHKVVAHLCKTSAGQGTDLIGALGPH